jgi:hypothetical protein
MMNWKGFGRKRWWLTREATVKFTSKGMKKPTRISGLAYIAAEAGTQHLSNTNL